MLNTLPVGTDNPTQTSETQYPTPVDLGRVAKIGMLYRCKRRLSPSEMPPFLSFKRAFFFGYPTAMDAIDNGLESGSFHVKTGQRDTSAASRAACVRGTVEDQVNVASIQGLIDESHHYVECRANAWH